MSPASQAPELKAELLPCPFCGATAELVEEHRNHWRVECPRCGVRRAQFANGGVEEDQARAVRHWNLRATPPQGNAALVERLKGRLIDLGYAENSTVLAMCGDIEAALATPTRDVKAEVVRWLRWLGEGWAARQIETDAYLKDLDAEGEGS